MSMQGDTQGQQSADTGNQSTNNLGQGSSDNSLTESFLANIPETERAIVGKYVPEWDKQVTQRFQGVHQEYAPYKELGSVDDLKAAIEVYQMLDSQPEVVYEALKQHFESQNQNGNQQLGQQQQQQQGQFQQQQNFGEQQQNLGGQQQQQMPEGFQQYLQPLQQKLEQQQGFLEKIAEVLVSGKQAETQAQEDKQLEDLMSNLHTQHGNFDENAVLLGIYQGQDPNQAVEAWKTSIQQFGYTQGGGNGLGLPPVLSGGAQPSEHVDVGKMKDKDVRDLVAGVMQATSQQT